jgi:chromate transport protein ChrA
VAPHPARSTRREALILLVPSLLAIALGFSIGKTTDAFASVLLVTPVTLISHMLTRWWSRANPAGAFLGMLCGVNARAAVIIGGGLLLYTQTDWFQGVALWMWIIGVYLSTLATELALWLSPRLGEAR